MLIQFFPTKCGSVSTEARSLIFLHTNEWPLKHKMKHDVW
jgi:hypothetical protein